MRFSVFALCFLAFAAVGPAAHAGEVLIKPSEAALPPASAAAGLALHTRGLTRRPNVIVLSPA
ncbi:MAG: hypothetical protein P8Y53_24910, partial [Pseudolabrys sp.]